MDGSVVDRAAESLGCWFALVASAMFWVGVVVGAAVAWVLLGVIR